MIVYYSICLVERQGVAALLRVRARVRREQQPQRV